MKDRRSSKQTANCVGCGTVGCGLDKCACSGHVHKDGIRYLASFCRGCWSEATGRQKDEALEQAENRTGVRKGCTGCFGDWTEADGDLVPG